MDKKPVIRIAMVDDTKSENILPCRPNMVIRDFRTAAVILQQCNVETLFLDYYLDNHTTGRDLLHKLQFSQSPLPKRLVFISSDDAMNKKLEEYALSIGYVTSAEKTPVSGCAGITMELLEKKMKEL